MARLRSALPADATPVSVAAALRFRPLARFDVEVPDAEPDDVIGLAELRRRVPVGRTDLPTGLGRPTVGSGAGERTTVR